MSASIFVHRGTRILLAVCWHMQSFANSWIWQEAAVTSSVLTARARSFFKNECTLVFESESFCFIDFECRLQTLCVLSPRNVEKLTILVFKQNIIVPHDLCLASTQRISCLTHVGVEHIYVVRIRHLYFTSSFSADHTTQIAFFVFLMRRKKR